ncbi:MAG: VOC family protein [Clostridia bacterium]|nr:VOC family protein [Clostridia bacterium]
MLRAIHHVAIICSDKDAALDFYHTKLGFPILRENYRADRDDWKIDLQLDEGTEIELFIMKDRPNRVSDPEAYGLRHLAFRVASVEETVRALKKRGIPCEPIRIDTFTGERMTFFRDPDGLPLEIHE